MKIVIYNETLLSGGIEKCIELLIENLYPNPEIEFEIVYIDEKKLDNNIVNILNKKATIHKITDTDKIEADICIWCRLYIDYENLKEHIYAKQNYLWVHSKPFENTNYVFNNKEFMNKIDRIICVSDTIKNLLPNYKEKATVIHNFLPNNINELSNEEIPEKVLQDINKLKLVTVSRLSAGKGFERAFNLATTLKNNNINFEYIIIGKGRALEQEIKDKFKNINEVKFLGYKDNPYPYIKKADYLVQLSDFETWGNVITEAKHLQKPVIVTNFSTAYEQIEDNKNGIIIDLNETNYEKYLKRIITKNSEFKRNLSTFIYTNEIEKWNNLIFLQ